MDNPVRVILIRHGETQWNVIQRYQGQSDSPLTEKGCEQAQCLASRLQAVTPAAIVTSDLGRAYATTCAIANQHAGVPIHKEPRLRERHFGILTGLTREEAANRFPTEEDGYLNGGPYYRIPNGESLSDLYERTAQAMEHWAKQYAGQTLIVVSHGGVLGQFLRYVVGIPLERQRYYKFVNCAYNVFTRETAGHWLMHCWGDTSHLDAIGAEDDI